MNPFIRRWLLAAVWWLTLALLTACNAAPPVESRPAAAQTEVADQANLPAIVIEEAWSRSTPQMMAGSGIAYMVIKNNGSQPDRLVASKTPAAAFSELHETSITEDGTMRMRGVKGGFIEIPPGGAVSLEPAGLHVMLIDLTDPLKSGTTFPLTLKFERAGEITIDVPVVDEEPEH